MLRIQYGLGDKKIKRIIGFLVFVLLSLHNVLASDLPSTSVYQFESLWMDQNRLPIELVDLAGRPQLVAFVYTYCEHTCPLIISRIKKLLASLPDGLKSRVDVTLITLDPHRDTPEQMRNYMEINNLPHTQWTMLTGSADDIRILSNLFGVKYKAMSRDELAHSNMITLLDSFGVIQSQLKGLNENNNDLLKNIVEMF